MGECGQQLVTIFHESIHGFSYLKGILKLFYSKGDKVCLFSDLENGSIMLLLLLSRFSRVRLCATPETAAHQAPPSLGFFRQEHWSGLPFPSPMHESEK